MNVKLIPKESNHWNILCFKLWCSCWWGMESLFGATVLSIVPRGGCSVATTFQECYSFESPQTIHGFWTMCFLHWHHHDIVFLNKSSTIIVYSVWLGKGQSWLAEADHKDQNAIPERPHCSDHVQHLCFILAHFLKSMSWLEYRYTLTRHRL